MKVPQFGEHMREELVLHGWDITGDDPAAQARLGEAWMTDHSVFAVGTPLLAKGAKQLGLGDECIKARLRVSDTNDVVLTADANSTTIKLASIEGDATLETDAAARVLLLWGRRPADPSRVCSKVGPTTLGRVRNLVNALPRDDRWHTLARAALREDLYAAHAALTADILTSTDSAMPAQDRLGSWIEANAGSVQRVASAVGEGSVAIPQVHQHLQRQATHPVG